MKTSKNILLAAAFVLLAGLGSAMAQSKMDVQNSLKMPPEPIVPVVKLNAIEVSDGTLGIDSITKVETDFGYSFMGRTSGALPGSFTLSMNCTPAVPMSGKESELTGGSWTLPVYMPEVRGGYAGSLYGTVAKGSMTWDQMGTTASVYIVLNVDGGTQAWDGVSGYVTFVGTLSRDEKTDKTTLTGELVFSIMSVNALSN